jgi:hypothetical protein
LKGNKIRKLKLAVHFGFAVMAIVKIADYTLRASKTLRV